MKFRLQPGVRSVVSDSIFLTGSTRSGTTMMSQLVNTLANVENFFEHPFTYLHLYLINDIPGDIWRFQLEAFLVEELMLQAMCGRNLNLNSHDDSWVMRGRPREEIEARLARTWRRQEAFPKMLERRLAFKMPEMLPQLGLIKQYYPEMTVLVMLRRPENVIASLIQKGWYSDAQMSGIGGEVIFKAGYDKQLPAWLPDDRVDEYLAMPEVGRAALCYLLQYRALVGRKDCVVVDYDKLVVNPHDYFSQICERIGCHFGQKTREVLDSIREPAKDRFIDLEKVDPAQRREMFDVYEACRALTL